MPRRSVVERLRIAYTMKIFGRLLQLRPRTLQACGEVQAQGAQPGRTFHGTGGQSGTHRYLYGRFLPLQSIFGFGRHPSPPGCGGTH